jgi:O-antigen/teichoic acid export membrane protein
MKKLQTTFIVMLFGRGIVFIQALVAMRIATALLKPIEIGRMNMLLSIISGFATLLIAPVANYVVRQTIEWYNEGKLIKALQGFTLFVGVSTILASILITLIYLNIGIGISINLIWLVLIVTFSLFLGTLNQAFINLLNILGFRLSYLILTNFNVWLGLGIAITLTMQFGKQAEYWMSGLLIAQVGILFPSGIAIYQLARRSKIISHDNTSGFNLRSVFIFSSPLILTTGLYWIQTNGYRFALLGFTDSATLGLFTTGLVIGGTPLKMFETVFTEYYQPIFYRDIAYSDTKQKAQAWNRYVSAYFPTIFLMGTFVGFGGPFLARLLVGQEFYQVDWLSVWGVLIQLSLMIYAAYVSFSFALLDTRRLVGANVFGTLVALGGTLLLASWNPMLGTAIALFLGMLVTMLITAFNLGIDFPLHLPWRRLGKAGALALPLMLMMELLGRIFLDPTVLQSFLSLIITGIYMLFAQFILAREWMFSNSSIVKIQD